MRECDTIAREHYISVRECEKSQGNAKIINIFHNVCLGAPYTDAYGNSLYIMEFNFMKSKMICDI